MSPTSPRRRGARAANAPLTRSKQDYLKALFTLGGEHTVATSSLAARLGVSAPSVTSMLRKLAAERLIAYTPRGGARLTDSGRRQALALIRRHRILETFLVRVLGFDWSEVHADAEILEHHISDRVLDAIDRLVGHPAEDPHGHVIPDAQGRMRRRALSPLAELDAGARATVREIRDADGRRMAHWKQVGLVPGASVRMREVRAIDDVYEVEVGGRRFVTGSEGLEGVMVERRRGES
jgi:DtxR family transcriptional regulator, Mn-dependent transcriptional regulator